MPPHFLTSNFRVAFEEYFKPDQQRASVDNLVAYIEEVRGMSEERQRELDVLRPQDTTQEQIDARIAAYLDKCHWQLAQFYRVSATGRPRAAASLSSPADHTCGSEQRERAKDV